MASTPVKFLSQEEPIADGGQTSAGILSPADYVQVLDAVQQNAAALQETIIALEQEAKARALGDAAVGGTAATDSELAQEVRDRIAGDDAEAQQRSSAIAQALADIRDNAPATLDTLGKMAAVVDQVQADIANFADSNDIDFDQLSEVAAGIQQLMASINGLSIASVDGLAGELIRIRQISDWLHYNELEDLGQGATANIHSALDALSGAGGGRLILPIGTIDLGDMPIKLESRRNVHISGAGQGASWLESDQGTFEFGTNVDSAKNCSVKGLSILNRGDAMVKCYGGSFLTFDDIYFLQTEPAKSIFDVSVGKMYFSNASNSVFSHKGQTVPTINIQGGADFQQNTFDKCEVRGNGSESSYFIHAEVIESGRRNSSNRVIGCWTEVWAGGLLKLLSAEDWLIEFSQFDVPTITVDSVYVGRSSEVAAMPGSRNINLRIRRYSGAHVEGLVDIRLQGHAAAIWNSVVIDGASHGATLDLGNHSAHLIAVSDQYTTIFNGDNAIWS